MTLFHIVLYLICLHKLKVYNWLFIPYFFGDEKKEVTGLVTYLFLPFEVMGPYVCNVIHVCFWFWFPFTTFLPIYPEYLIQPVCKYYTYNSIDKKVFRKALQNFLRDTLPLLFEITLVCLSLVISTQSLV